jgi:hypothetical protein
LLSRLTVAVSQAAGAIRWKLNGTGFHGTAKLTMLGTSSMLPAGLTYPAGEDRPALSRERRHEPP